MLIEHQHPNNKSIMVSVLGAPNVGKSSLINYLLGQDLNIVSPKSQTTRNRVNSIFTVDHTEIILIDTPGLHSSNKEFNKRINQQAREGVDGADLNLLLLDSELKIQEQVENFKKNLNKNLGKTWVVFTKADLLTSPDSLDLDSFTQKISQLIPQVEKSFMVSSKTEYKMNELIGAICDEAQPGPHLYGNDRISNKNERFFVSEYIREQSFSVLKEELPYELCVVINKFEDLQEKKEENKSPIVAAIDATILVNRPSQRAIVVGTKGANIKKIGSMARKRIEELLGGQVGLKLHVKVSNKWFKNNVILEQIGLPRAPDSNRVWRSQS